MSVPFMQQFPPLFIGDHSDPKSGFFSMHFPAKFRGTSSGTEYGSRWQYIVAGLAEYSGMSQIADEIAKITFNSINPDGSYNAAATNEADQKIVAILTANSASLKVDYWKSNIWYFMERSIMLSFCQNKQLFDLLMATDGVELLDTDVDRDFGIGMSAAVANQTPRPHWGKNVHGYSLMKVRDALKKTGWEGRPVNSYQMVVAPPTPMEANNIPGGIPSATRNDVAVVPTPIQTHVEVPQPQAPVTLPQNDAVHNLEDLFNTVPVVDIVPEKTEEVVHPVSDNLLDTLLRGAVETVNPVEETIVQPVAQPAEVQSVAVPQPAEATDMTAFMNNLYNAQ